MQDAVRVLAAARQQLAAEKANMDTVQADIKVLFGDRLAIAEGQLGTAKAAVRDAEKVVRVAALDRYAQDGDKHPHPAITIKVYTVLDYDERSAIEYARVFASNALKLDRRAFERAAKDTLKVIERGVYIGDAAKVLLATVTQRDNPRATIARDLGGY